MNPKTEPAEFLTPWSVPRDWFGQHWTGWYVVLGRNRDSGHLENSNYETALAALRALPAVKAFAGEIDGEEMSPVQSVCENHWAVGWVEWIAVHPSCPEAMVCAAEIKASLADYPVLNDNDFYDREETAAQETWDSMSTKERLHYTAKLKLPCFAARHDWSKLGGLYEIGDLRCWLVE